MSTRRRAAAARKPTAAERARSDMLRAEHMLANAETDILNATRLVDSNWAEILLRGLQQVDQARLLLIAAAHEVIGEGDAPKVKP